MGQPSFPVFNRVGMSQLWLFSQVRSYKKNYYSSSFQKNIFFWKFLPLFFSYGMLMHRVNIYKSSYFFVNRRIMYVRNKENFKYIYKRIFHRHLYKRYHKIRYGRYEFFDNERTYTAAPLSYRAPFFKSVYFSKLWIFKLSNYIFLKLHLIISDEATYDGKTVTFNSRRGISRRRRYIPLNSKYKKYKKPRIKSLIKNSSKRRYSRLRYPVSTIRAKKRATIDFKYFFIRSKYLFKMLNIKFDNSSSYFWF